MTVDVRLSPLEALMLRAGASDQDRPAWLAQRRLGITATEIRDLMLGTKKSADLIAEKLGRRSNDFAGNAYTAWGNEREPVIAALLAERHGIQPETRLFRAVDNERFLCSPDGIGVDFMGDLLGQETKTAGEDISVGSHGYVKKGYGFQITWCMRVTGARRWAYAHEPREGTIGAFTPGPLTVEWIDYDEALADRMEAVALQFLADLDAAAADEYVEPDIDDVLDTHAVNYLRFHADEKAATEAKKTEWAAMLERLEGCDEVRQVGATARVTYNPPVVTETDVPDVDAAVLADPALKAELDTVQAQWAAHQEKYTKTVTSAGRASLTVSQIKETKK